MDENTPCKNCKHVYYDHCTFRTENDKRTSCRIVRCGCEAFVTTAMSHEWYYE